VTRASDLQPENPFQPVLLCQSKSIHNKTMVTSPGARFNRSPFGQARFTNSFNRFWISIEHNPLPAAAIFESPAIVTDLADLEEEKKDSQRISNDFGRQVENNPRPRNVDFSRHDDPQLTSAELEMSMKQIRSDKMPISPEAVIRNLPQEQYTVDSSEAQKERRNSPICPTDKSTTSLAEAF
jgi:hypothetical protein